MYYAAPGLGKDVFFTFTEKKITRIFEIKMYTAKDYVYYAGPAWGVALLSFEPVFSNREKLKINFKKCLPGGWKYC